MPDLSSLAQPLIEQPPHPRPPVHRLRQRIAQRRRRRLLACGTVAVLLAAGVAGALQGNDPAEVVTTGRASPSSTVSTVSSEVPEGLVGVTDGAGRLRGYVRQEDLSLFSTPQTLPGGFAGTPVRDERGRLTGFLVTGVLGFVDIETASDGTKLASLERCYEVYVESHETPDNCADLLREQGVNLDPQVPIGR